MSNSRAGFARAAASPGPPAVPEQVDAEISAALSRGETRRALSLCVERHGPSIGRLCMAMLGTQEDADEAAQATLLSAYEAFGDYRGEGPVRGFLLGIARNACLKHLEQKRRGNKLGRGPHGRASARPEQAPGHKRRADRARALLEHVKPSDRDALLMRFAADLSFKDVAAACGIDEPVARKRVSRALLRLRSALEEEHDDD